MLRRLRRLTHYRCCQIWPILFSFYLAGTIYLAVFQFRGGQMIGVKHEEHFKVPSDDYNWAPRDSIQNFQTYHPLSVPSDLRLLSNKTDKEDNSDLNNALYSKPWNTNYRQIKNSNSSLHLKKNPWAHNEPMRQETPLNLHDTSNFSKDHKVDSHLREDNVKGRETKEKAAAVVKDEEKLALINGAKEKPVKDFKDNKKKTDRNESRDKPNSDVKPKQKSPENNNKKNKLGIDPAGKRGPEENNRNKKEPILINGGEGKSALDIGHDGKPVANIEGKRKPVVDTEEKLKPAADTSHNKKSAVDVEGKGKSAADAEGKGKSAADAEGKGKSAADGEGKGKFAEDTKYMGKSAVDVEGKRQSAANTEGKEKSATNAKGKGKSAADGKGKGKSAADAKGKGKSAADGKGKGKSATDAKGEGKSAADAKVKGKSAADAEGKGKSAADAESNKEHVAGIENKEKQAMVTNGKIKYWIGDDGEDKPAVDTNVIGGRFMAKPVNNTSLQQRTLNPQDKAGASENRDKKTGVEQAPTGFIGAKGKTILLWTSLTAKRPLWNFKTWTLMRCPYKCQVTNDRGYLSEASLVLFRLRMLRTVPNKFLREFVQDYDVTDLPERKYPQQVWVDVNQESPMYSHSDEELLAVDNYIDYVVSYLSQSDYTYAYKSLYRERKQRLPPINYAANKTKTVLWYVSHCADLSGRWRYVEELKKYNVSVDVFGKCTGMQDGCQGYKDLNCVNTLKARYKFYLAFENSICSEYITEKYWNMLNSSSKMYNIPIALGARLHEYKALSPENSFLHVRNFTGPKELAQYIHEIDKDDKKFNSYHSWREKYETYMEKQELLDCWMCRMAYEQPKTTRPVYSQFWSRKKLCDLTPEPI